MNMRVTPLLMSLLIKMLVSKILIHGDLEIKLLYKVK